MEMGADATLVRGPTLSSSGKARNGPYLPPWICGLAPLNFRMQRLRCIARVVLCARDCFGRQVKGLVTEVSGPTFALCAMSLTLLDDSTAVLQWPIHTGVYYGLRCTFLGPN